jgi:hypothetical protein
MTKDQKEMLESACNMLKQGVRFFLLLDHTFSDISSKCN